MPLARTVKPKVIGFDTEATGLSVYHGAQPFMVMAAYDNGDQLLWEWSVDPLTRKVDIQQDDVLQIREVLDSADVVVTQHGKFDAGLLLHSGVIEEWDWLKNDDTLISGHLLASNHPHSLDAMSIEYVGEDIRPLEDTMHAACNEARRLARSKFPTWRIAKEGLEEMPSAKGGKDKRDRGVDSESPWKADTWLPKLLAKTLKYPEPKQNCEHNWIDKWVCSKCRGHHWWTVTREYATMDPAITLLIWRQMEHDLKQRNLWKIYQESKKMPRLAHLLQVRPVTVNKETAFSMREKFKQEIKEASKVCVDVAAEYEVEQCLSCRRLVGVPTASFDKWCACKNPQHVLAAYDLELPNGAVNDSLRAFCFQVLNLEHITNPKAKTDAPTLDSKNAIPHYLRTLALESNELKFINAFADRNSFTTAVSYLNSYEKYWIPLAHYNERGEQLWMGLHSSLDPTGTDHLRWSSSDPNLQNISSKESECRHCDGDGCGRCGMTGVGKNSLRGAFGPAPGREWWSLDASNIERRMPAYDLNETMIIELLEEPNKPPYYGSEHALVGHIIFPEEFEGCKDSKGVLDARIFKKVCKNEYHRSKCTNLALQYRCGEKTADRTSGVPGSYRAIKSRFVAQERANSALVAFANKNGYVETIPDRDVDPDRGYPIMCARGWGGRVLETVPFNYKYSGSAMWWMRRSMAKVQACLDEWNKKLPVPLYFMTLQVHDEIVLDFPKRANPQTNPKGSNLWRVREVQRLMESCGPPMGIKTPVSVTYNPVNWAQGVSF